MDSGVLRDLQTGFSLQGRGDLEGACRLYEAVLERDPRNEYALNLLGVVHLRRGSPSVAIKFLAQALNVNGRDAETHNNVGLALEALGDLPGAALAFEQSLKLKADQPVVLNNLGNVRSALGDALAAIRCYEAALACRPGYAECLGNLAASLVTVHRLEDAERCAREGVALAPESGPAQMALGRVLMAAARFEEAQVVWERLLKHDPGLIDARIQLSTACKQLRDENAARQLLESVLRDDPDNTEAHKCLGVLLEQTGDFEGAERAFREAIRAAPRHGSAYYQLAKLTTSRLTDSEVESIRALLADESTSKQSRGPLCFAMACVLEKQGRFEESLDYYLEGNRARSDGTYDTAADDAYCEAVSTVDFRDDTRRSWKSTDFDFTPIFVLGMPRSGTTLTEQVLAAHSAVGGSGESGSLTEVAVEASRLTGMPNPASLSKLNADQVGKLRSLYGKRIRRLCPEGRFIVDKTPANFQLIGLIRVCFPEAPIIYCRREPVDNCLSIFRLPFDQTQTYSHDLMSLGRYYLCHKRLMRLWLERFPKAIMTVQYEDTVADLEQQARRMLKFIGISFEPQVLEFHDSERLVLTPSAQQVRRPIYQSSVGLWRRYGARLRPLAELLGAPDQHDQAQRALADANGSPVGEG
jgi:tetratricopeptide (TPR) repeat protein